MENYQAQPYGLRNTASNYAYNIRDEDDVKQPCKKTEYKQVGQLWMFVLCMYSCTTYSDNLEGLRVLLRLQI